MQQPPVQDLHAPALSCAEMDCDRTFGGNPSESEVNLRTVVEDKHQSSANAPQDICHETLVQSRGQSLLRGDLLEAIAGALVEMLLWGLLRLHLQATTNRVERVSRTGTNGDRCLSGSEGAHRAKDTLPC